MRFHKIDACNLVNGDGVRVVLWVSGCEHGCHGCFNSQTQSEESGNEFTTSHLISVTKLLSKKHISGITFSGGDPLFPANQEQILKLCQNIRHNFGDTKTIWLYTGYSFEHCISSPDLKPEILKYVDVLVDGRFVESKASTEYKWAGSTNQRVIDIPTTLQKGEVALYSD